MPRILIVDDDETFRTTLQALLEDVECECRVVKSGDEAIIELRQESYDLVITDFDMPVVGGIELLTRMDEVSLLSTTPVIIITDQVSPMLEKIIMKAGAYALLIKPYDIEQLFALVSQALEARIKENFPENDTNA